MKDFIIQELHKWIGKLIQSIKKDPLQKILIIFISPFLIHALAEALVDLSLFATIVYYTVCIYGFPKIVDDPYRIIKWGVGYIIGASVTPMIFSRVWPEIQKGTYASIFSALVILYMVISILLKTRKLKNS